MLLLDKAATMLSGASFEESGLNNIAQIQKTNGESFAPPAGRRVEGWMLANDRGGDCQSAAKLHAIRMLEPFSRASPVIQLDLIAL
ncbi:MAG TPA: hypothetical protein VIF40_10890 [Methylosinus sp.]|jgi:hypothetical protein|uniref:hypothetical protein n=1 Tax=Methylosinus sp. TaxID=427 RepID=UPI002F94E591